MPDIGDAIILVMCAASEYRKYKQKLLDKGLVEFKNFIWYKFFDKKVCLINANCHGPWLESYLRRSPSFMRTYEIYPFQALWALSPESKIILNDSMLDGVDLFLYQHMGDDNILDKTYADSFTLSKLKDDCIKISIPNYYDLGTAVYQHLINKPITSSYGVTHQDNILENINIENLDFQEVLSVVNNYHEDRAVVIKKFNDVMERFRKREERWDIHVYDWVMENYKTLPMFTCLAHPSGYLMLYTCMKILEKLGFYDILPEIKKRNEECLCYCNWNLNLYNYGTGTRSYLYPYVKEALGINYEYSTIKRKIDEIFGGIVCEENLIKSMGIYDTDVLKRYFLITKNVMLKDTPKPDSVREIGYSIEAVTMKNNIIRENNQYRIMYKDDLRCNDACKIVEFNKEALSLFYGGGILFGPYVDFEAGEYEVEFKFYKYDYSQYDDNHILCKVDVFAGMNTIVAERELRGIDFSGKDSCTIRLKFSLTQKANLEFRVISCSDKRFYCRTSRRVYKM